MYVRTYVRMVVIVSLRLSLFSMKLDQEIVQMFRLKNTCYKQFYVKHTY